MDMNIAAMYEKLSTQSNANQSAHAMRVGTALEAAAMRVTDTLRGAGRWLLSGSRARSAIGEAEAH